MVRQFNPSLTGANQVLGRVEESTLRVFLFMAVLLAFASGACSAAEGTNVPDHEDAIAAPDHSQETNVFCPVMPDMKVNPDIFTDYQGKRVYFCCLNCRAAFGRNPEKYLALLPQFGGVVAHTAQDHGHNGAGLTLPGLVKPAGIATLSCLVLTVATALLRRKKPRLLLKWHKRLGIATLVLALIHLTLVLIAH